MTTRTRPSIPSTYMAGAPLPYQGEASLCQAMSFALNPPRVRVYCGVNGSTNVNGFFDWFATTVDVDTDGFTSGTAPFQTFKIPYTGTYDFSFSMNFSTIANSSNGVGLQMLQTYASTGLSTVVAYGAGPGYGATPTAPYPTGLLHGSTFATVGDVITPQYYVSSTVVTSGSGLDRSYFDMRMVATS